MLTVGLKMVDAHPMINIDALSDGGATSLFINCELVQNNGIGTWVLEHPISDGTKNKGGSIMEEVCYKCVSEADRQTERDLICKS